ncbi:MAG TPA: LytR C-terminal domain-containing protein [Rubricoccaceae bacterium]|nr:LytR C-terminal domain-containing protein [Rubricoccaceae bacterium]
MGRLADVLLNTALVVAGLLVLVLLYGLAARTFTPHPDAGREAAPEGLIGDVVQVEVRNGAGTSGLAATLTRYLRRRGFDVIESGNYSSFDIDSTFVVDRIGDGAAAGRVADAVGVDAARVRVDTAGGRFLDASIVIGRDYAAFPPFQADSLLAP